MKSSTLCHIWGKRRCLLNTNSIHTYIHSDQYTCRFISFHTISNQHCILTILSNTYLYNCLSGGKATCSPSWVLIWIILSVMGALKLPTHHSKYSLPNLVNLCGHHRHTCQLLLTEETSNTLLCSIYKTEATCRTSWQCTKRQKDICPIAYCTLSLYIFGKYLHTNTVNFIQVNYNTF